MAMNQEALDNVGQVKVQAIWGTFEAVRGEVIHRVIVIDLPNNFRS